MTTEFTQKRKVEKAKDAAKSVESLIGEATDGSTIAQNKMILSDLQKVVGDLDGMDPDIAVRDWAEKVQKESTGG